MENLVSILVPAYNAEKYISTCLDSCLEQTYQNWQVVCVNDGSDDNTQNIIKIYSEHDERITYIDLEANAGISNAIAVARNNCNGNIIALLDSDDWYEPNHLERCLEVMTYTEADLMNVDMNYYDEESIFLNKVSNWNAHPDWHFKLNPFETFSFNIGPTKIFKKYLLDGVRFKKYLNNLQDTCTSFQLSVNSKKAIHIPETLYNRRIRNDSTYHIKKLPQKELADIERVFNICLEFLTLTNRIKKYQSVLEQWRLRMIYRNLENAYDYSKNDFKEYLSILRDYILGDIKYNLLSVITQNEYFLFRHKNLSVLLDHFGKTFKKAFVQDKKKFYRYKMLNKLHAFQKMPKHIDIYNSLLKKMHTINLALNEKAIVKTEFRKNKRAF